MQIQRTADEADVPMPETDEVIDRPMFATGEPRSGTTLAHALMAADPQSLSRKTKQDELRKAVPNRPLIVQYAYNRGFMNQQAMDALGVGTSSWTFVLQPQGNRTDQILLGAAAAQQERVEPVYETLPGWKTSTAQARTSVGDQTTSATLTLVEEQGDWRVDGIRSSGG